VTQKFIIVREWDDFPLLESNLNLDCCNFRPYNWLMYNYSSVTVMGGTAVLGGVESKGKAK
jgi:hypothetical protein